MSLELKGDFEQEDVVALANNPAAANLRSLSLRHRVSKTSIEAIAKSPYLASLIYLSIYGDETIDDQVLEILRDAPFGDSLRFLSVGNQFSLRCLKKLKNPSYFPKLRRLFAGVKGHPGDPRQGREALKERPGLRFG